MKSQAKAWGKAVTREDGGQVAMGLVTCVLLALAALLMWFIVPVSAATDQSNRAQTAADAAALGAGKALIKGLDVELAVFPLDVDGKLALEQKLSTGSYKLLGRAAAIKYAEDNGARLTSFGYDYGSDRVTVTVQMRDDLEDTSRRAEAEAHSELGMDWGDCEFEAKQPPPTPPGVMPDVLKCGSDTFAYLYYTSTSRTAVNPVQFTSLLEPRLVD